MAKTYSEDYARDILLDHPVDTDALVELLFQIDGELKLLYGAVAPQIAAVYGGYQQALNARRWHHPRFQDYMRGIERNSDAVFLRKRIRRNFFAVIRVKLFLRRVVQNFLEEHYAPGGAGYERTHTHWTQSV